MADLNFGQAIIIYFISPILFLIQIVLIVNIIMSWLISFGVVNTHNQLVAALWRMTSSLVEPFLSPIRRVLPPLGGLDLSPLVLILVIIFVRQWVLGQLLVMLA
jgi:YggT family protein